MDRRLRATERAYNLEPTTANLHRYNNALVSAGEEAFLPLEHLQMLYEDITNFLDGAFIDDSGPSEELIQRGVDNFRVVSGFYKEASFRVTAYNVFHPPITWERMSDFDDSSRYIYWLNGQKSGCLNDFTREVQDASRYSAGRMRKIGGLDRIGIQRKHSWLAGEKIFEEGWEAVFYGWGGPTFAFAEAITLAEVQAAAERWVWTGEEHRNAHLGIEKEGIYRNKNERHELEIFTDDVIYGSWHCDPQTSDIHRGHSLHQFQLPINQPWAYSAEGVLDFCLQHWDEVQRSTLNVRRHQRRNPRNPDLDEFIYLVQEDFIVNQANYLAQAGDILSHVEIVGIELIGSYSPDSSRQPTEESDIDLRVSYRGSLSEQEVAEGLYGQIHGFGGVFDIIPHKLAGSD
jgi:hypothetical protein